MHIETSVNGITLHRDAGDKALSHEHDVTHHLRRLLNERDGGGWTRFWPDCHGLTSCRQGVRNIKTELWYWHERYQIEAAHKAFNEGSVFYLDADK